MLEPGIKVYKDGWRLMFTTLPKYRNQVNYWNPPATAAYNYYIIYREATYQPISVRTDFVFALSAFWHGIRPGYYLCFFSAPPMIKFQQKVGNLTREARAASHALEMAYRVAMWLFVRLMSCMFLAAFYILDLNTILAVSLPLVFRLTNLNVT